MAAMAKREASVMRRTARAGIGLLAGVACVAALPSALAAVAGQSIAPAAELNVADSDVFGTFTPASVNPKLLDSLRRASASAAHANGLFRFTPAGSAKPGSRSVTVAIRVDPETAHAISIRKAGEQAGRGITGIAPVAFNLGVARGYQSFAQAGEASTDTGTGRASKLTLSDEIGDLRAPDLRSFTPAKSASGKSRFSTVVELDDVKTLPGSTPRTLSGAGEMSVDVGGAYRVADNLKVTAGIRYSSERDRIAPLTDGQMDSQSVYVGTRFRF